MMDYVEWRSFWELTNFKSFTVVSFFGFHFHLELFKNHSQGSVANFQNFLESYVDLLAWL